MAFTSGVFSLVAGNPVVTGTTISSTTHNNTESDIADNGLTICLLKDGTQTVTANIPFGAFRLTNIGNATALTDAARASQVQNSSFNVLTSITGVSTITGAATPTPSAYAEGQIFSFITVGANAAAPTLNVSSLGARPIFWNGATATSSMWRTGAAIDVVYISTSSQTGFHVVGHSGFMPVNLLRVRGSVAFGSGAGNAEILAPGADDQVVFSTASATAGAAWGAFDRFAATQAQMEAATSTANYVPPLRQQFHPSAAKMWLRCNEAGSIAVSYNVTSITDVGVGNVTVTIATDFSSGSYVVNGTALTTTGALQVCVTDQLAGSFGGYCSNNSDTRVDPASWMFSAFGDQ